MSFKKFSLLFLFFSAIVAFFFGNTIRMSKLKKRRKIITIAYIHIVVIMKLVTMYFWEIMV